MRPTAFLLLAALATGVVADEPKRNPFRDGTGKASPEPPPTPLTTPVRQGPRILKPADVGIGRLVPDVGFTDITGKVGKLSDYKGSKLLVVAFTDTGCPLCKKYAPTLARIEKEYARRGVAVLFVNPTSSDTPKDIKAVIADHGFQGRYVHDTGGKLAAAFGVKSTTEVFVLDPARSMVYRGAVDDQYGLAYSLDAPRNHYLATALDRLLAGQQPIVAATTAPGCELEAKEQPATDLTYHSRIERIVQSNCVECHRSGGVAPFALETYEQVVARRGAIRRAVDGGTMPPWFAAAPAKGEHSPWLNDRSLAPADKADLLAWLAGDRKKGNPADAPLPRTYPSEWLIGKPDVVFQIPQPVAVKATGTMPYQKATVETNFEEDRWVQAMEVQPTAREVVHHVLIHVVQKDRLRLLGRGEEDGTQGFFAIYVPGNNTLIYPDGYAKKLPKGASLRFQIHYTPNGKATTDQTRVAMVFAKQPPRHEVRVAGIVNSKFEIPAGAANHEVDAKISIPWNVKILAFVPHMHLRGKAARYELRQADGTTKVLLDVPRYDFNWQLLYRFADPVAAPRGSSLTFTAWFDNSSANPANPDATKPVRWGQQTTEEMHLGYVEYVIDR